MDLTEIKVGNYSLMGQLVLNLKDDQIGSFRIDAGYRVDIVFRTTINPSIPDAKISWNPLDTGCLIEAWNWTNRAETLVDPIAIAQNNQNGKDVCIQIVNFKIGPLNNCHVDIYEV